MIEFGVVNSDNQALRQVVLREEVFGREVRGDLLAWVVDYQLARRRSGSAFTKGRAEVVGGGKKPYRQKGTGNARQGTVRAPQFRTGGIVFGPRPRSYAGKVPKKVRRFALQIALSAKREAGELVVLDFFSLDKVRTKDMGFILSTLGVERSALIILAEDDAKVVLSARNLPGLDVVRVEGVNVYDLLAHEKVVMTEAALDKLQERLA